MQTDLENTGKSSISKSRGYKTLLIEGTNAAIMREKFKAEWFSKRIKLSEITDRLSKIDIPKWLRAEIIEMFEYRWPDRIKDSVEEAMFDAVCRHIVRELLEAEQVL